MNGYALELIAHYHLLVYVVAISYRMTWRRERGEALCGSEFFSCPSSSQAKQLPYQPPYQLLGISHVYVRAFIKHETF